MLQNLKQQVSVSVKKQLAPAPAGVYTQYRMAYRELAFYSIRGFGIVALFAYFFYHSLLAALLLSPYVVYYLKKKKKELCGQRQWELCMQFKEMILSLSTCLYAGYSVENAFREVYKDMQLLYGKDSLICKEVQHIAVSLDNNAVLEKLLSDFGARSGVEDICEFAEVFAIGKRSSGDIKEIIRSAAAVIGEKIEIKRDIRTILSAKILEQKIMKAVPFGIIFYIGMTSKGFFDPLYHNAAGVLIMTGCLAVYLFADYLLGKIIPQ